MKCKEIMNKLEERWNPSYALPWDNVGLLVGREDKEIHKIFTALDVTDETLGQALLFGADMMITHHPLLFSPVKKINSGDFIGRRLIKMIQSDLCCYAMHTNFDVMGMAELNEKMLKLCDTEVLAVTSSGTDIEKPEGIGRVGQLMEETSLERFAGDVKKEFDIPQIRIYGDMQRKIRRVAVSSGSGKSMVSEALNKNADVIVTGDIDYHTGIDAVAAGIAVIDAGHYGTEYCFIEYMENELKKMFPECETGKAAVGHPFQVM